MNTLQTFASGDTNYISKHNANISAISAAVAFLEQAVQGAGNSETNWTEWLNGMYGAGPTLIGANSYKTTGESSTVTVTAGSVWLGDVQKIVSSETTVTISMAGQTSGTYYIVPNSAGTPTRSTTSTNAVYSFNWSGSSVGSFVRRAAVAFSSDESPLVWEAAVRLDLSGWKNGAPSSSEVLVRYVMPRQTSFQAAFAGSRFKAETAATATTTFSVKKNGVEIGTAAFAAGGTSATFTMASANVFSAGDVLTLVAPASADATLAGLAFTFVGVQTF